MKSRGRRRASESRRTILVVDDEAEIRDMLAEILRGARHRVVATAASGREALQRMAVERYDVIFTDMRMPDLDGRALYRRSASAGRASPQRVVFVTGDTLTVDAARVRRRRAGARSSRSRSCRATCGASSPSSRRATSRVRRSVVPSLAARIAHLIQGYAPPAAG